MSLVGRNERKLSIFLSLFFRETQKNLSLSLDFFLSKTGCTGKRDRAAFVPVSAMTDATLASDIGLLEEVERAAAAAQRGAALPPPLAEAVAKAAKAGGAGGAKNPSSRFRGGAHRGDQPSPSLPQHLQQLVAEAGRRGVRLRLAPPGFDARRRNGTRYEGKQKKMQWHLEWRFYSSCSSSSTDFVTREDRRIREDAALGPFLRRHLEAKKEEEEEEGTTSAAMATATAETTAISLPRSFAVAEKGASSPLPFRALLRLDGRPANNPGWLDFSLSDHFDEKVTLAELLRGRTVDEFPVVALFAGSPSSSTLMLPPGEVVPFARAAPAIVTLS